MNRCIGCGIIVQTSFPDKPGYVPENTIIAHPKEFYCKRCYDIRNHNFQYRVDNQSANYLEKLKKIQYEKALVIVLVDIFNISNHFFASVKMCVGKNKILVIFNKIDLLPKDLKVIKFKKIIDLLATNNQLEVIDTLFGSVKKNSFVSQIISKINKLKYPRFFDKKNKTEPSFYNCYLIGMSNVGKSTLMNKIGQICLHYKTDIITTSSQLQTTLDFIKWPLNDKNFIVDTPGIIEPHHFGTYLTSQSLNVLIAEKYIKTRTFQLDSNQTIFLGGLVRIDFFGDEKINASFYVANELYLHRTKTQNAQKVFETNVTKLLVPPYTSEEKAKIDKLKTMIFQIDKPTDIFICGIGFVHFSSVKAQIKITTYEMIDVEMINYDNEKNS